MVKAGGLLFPGQQKDGDPISIGVTGIISSKVFGEDRAICIFGLFENNEPSLSPKRQPVPAGVLFPKD
jgi:hypothetical protein